MAQTDIRSLDPLAVQTRNLTDMVFPSANSMSAVTSQGTGPDAGGETVVLQPCGAAEAVAVVD